MAEVQLGLLENEQVRPYNVPFPTTRYQGSKRSIVNWILSIPEDEIETEAETSIGENDEESE